MLWFSNLLYSYLPTPYSKLQNNNINQQPTVTMKMNNLEPIIKGRMRLECLQSPILPKLSLFVWASGWMVDPTWQVVFNLIKAFPVQRAWDFCWNQSGNYCIISTVWGRENNSLTKNFFKEKLRNEMSIETFEKLQKIPENPEVTKYPELLNIQERPKKPVGFHLWLTLRHCAAVSED